MNVILSDTTTSAVAPRLVDAMYSFSPIPIIKLKTALKKEATNTTLALQTTDPEIGRDLRDFCTATGNLYLGVERIDGHDVHYIKKQSVTCQTCSTARMVMGGLAAVAALAYSAPMVVAGDPSAPVTLLFIAAIVAVPPLLVNNTRLLSGLIRKSLQD
jgi:TusA-related sulfurtransferase